MERVEQHASFGGLGADRNGPWFFGSRLGMQLREGQAA